MYVNSSCHTVCASGYYYFLHSEFVRELILEVQSDQKQKAVRTVTILGSSITDSIIPWKGNFIKPPTTTQAWSVNYVC